MSSDTLVALLSAIESGDNITVEALIRRDDSQLNLSAMLPGRNAPALVVATCADRAEIVAALLIAGADIDAVDKWGRTACHVVASESVLACLLAHKPNLTEPVRSVRLHGARRGPCATT